MEHRRKRKIRYLETHLHTIKKIQTNYEITDNRKNTYVTTWTTENKILTQTKPSKITNNRKHKATKENIKSKTQYNEKQENQINENHQQQNWKKTQTNDRIYKAQTENKATYTKKHTNTNTPTTRNTRTQNYNKFYWKNLLWRIHENHAFSTKTYIRTCYKTHRKRDKSRLRRKKHININTVIWDYKQKIGPMTVEETPAPNQIHKRRGTNVQ